MRLEQLNYLVVVAECGSINRAAEKLFVSQPTISTSIKLLEDELQVQLLTRTRNGVIPTIHGERVITDAERLFGILKSWEDLANAETEKIMITIDFSGPSSDIPLFNFYFKMRELYPHIEIRLNFYNKPLLEMDSDAPIIHACSASKLGEALSYGRKSYRVSRLYEDKYKLFFCERNLPTSENIVKIDDLRNKTIATRSRPSTFPYHKILSDLSCKMLYLGDDNIVFNAAAQGYAIALLPAMQGEKNALVASGELRCSSIADVNFPFYHYLLTPLDRILSTDERILYNYMKLHYDELIS